MKLLAPLFFLVLLNSVMGKEQKTIVVSQDGKGDYKTIQGAISSLSDTSSDLRLIYIKKGIYKEKIYIEKHNILLKGEGKEEVVVSVSISRDEWRCAHADDWGVATVNVESNDVTLKNLTVINSFGFEWEGDKYIECFSDTGSQQKVITRASHQMAVRTFKATRFRAINCHFKSYGGDTMSPWNVSSGLYYFKDCVMEGGVDLYCPRGWAYAENCTFIITQGDAIIWHDGSEVEDSKTVFKDCSFKGYDGFRLGRYHRDAQFYLINCTFAENMADKAIYLVPTNNIIQWGNRVYYHNCHKIGGDYPWFANNFSSAPVLINPLKVNANWVFGNQWDL